MHNAMMSYQQQRIFRAPQTRAESAERGTIAAGKAAINNNVRNFYQNMSKLLQFYRATVYASALYAVIVRLYVCPSVRPSQAGIVSKLQDDSNWVWNGGFLTPIVHCIIKIFGYL